MGLRIKELLTDNRILQFVIVTAVAVLCLMVWPFRVFYHEAVSEGRTGQPYYTDDVTMEQIVLQQFTPGGDYLSELAVGCRVTDVHALDRVFVTIYDKEFAIVYQEVPYFTEIEGWGEIRIAPKLDVIPGETYYVGLNVHYESVGRLQAAYAEAGSLQIVECGALSYASAPLEGMQLMMRFVYTKPYSLLRILCTIAVILAAGAALYTGLSAGICLLKKKERWEIARRILAVAFFAAVAAGTLAAAWFLCAERIFGGAAADLTVYALAVLSILLVTGYACYRSLSGTKQSHGVTVKFAGMGWRDYLQMVCFALLIWAGVRYTDAVIQWEQDLSGCWVYLLFGVCLLLSLPGKSVIHPFTLIWAVIMILLSVMYCHANGADAHEAQISRCLMAGVFVWGIVFLHVLWHWRQQISQRTCLPAAFCFSAFCVLAVINRHGKTWPVFMLVTFLLFYLISYTEEEKQKLMHNYMNGVIFHFLWMWIMCLCFRPYHYYRFNRYPMYFHTVASTGMYLVMVEAVVIVRLFTKIRDSRSLWRGAWKEWLLQAVVLGYTVLSIARTALAAVGGLVLLLLIAAAIVYRPRIRTCLSAIGVGICTVILFLPAVYTLTRCVPAVVNRPVRLGDQEQFGEAVVEGERLDSPRYMNVEALLKLWGNRIGAPEMSEDRLSAAAEAGGMPLTVLGTLASASLEQGGSLLNDVSNGRFGIYREYLSRLNLNGHEQMGISENGVEAMHAHNSFIQIAYDFGIPAGICYIGLMLGMFGRSVYLIWRGRDRSEMQFMALAMLMAFLIVSMFEYTANPCLPMGFASLFVLFTMRRKKSILFPEDSSGNIDGISASMKKQ